MRGSLVLAIGGMLAAAIFVTGDRKRMRSVLRWIKKGDLLSKLFSWTMVRKVMRQFR